MDRAITRNDVKKMFESGTSFEQICTRIVRSIALDMGEDPVILCNFAARYEDQRPKASQVLAKDSPVPKPTPFKRNK